MDAYLNILNWSLDTTKAHALLARLPKIPRRFGYCGRSLLLLLPSSAHSLLEQALQ